MQVAGVICCPRIDTADAKGARKIKVFWFFFSKKNCFPAFCFASRGAGSDA
jgi:hypothetical protein